MLFLLMFVDRRISERVNRWIIRARDERTVLRELSEKIEELRPELLFPDIEMRGLKGFEVPQSIPFVWFMVLVSCGPLQVHVGH